MLRKIGIINSVLVVCLTLVLFISGLAIAQETDLFIQAQKARQQGDTDSAYRLYEQAAEPVSYTHLPIAINSATFVGYRIGGVFGAAIATGSFCLPSIGFILFISKFISAFEGNDKVQKIMKGLRPSVIALMSLAGYSIAQNGIIDWFAVGLSVVSFILVWKNIIDPIFMLILAGLAGIVYYR